VGGFYLLSIELQANAVIQPCARSVFARGRGDG
jgi:hypothetical protein